jgi:flagellar assembly factor FliW
MTIRLLVSPQFEEEETEILISGKHEDDVAMILVSRLFAAEYEVSVENAEGELIDFEEHDNG